MSENHFRSHFLPLQIDTELMFLKFLTKWPPAAILDVRNSLSIAFLAISDRYRTFFFFLMAILDVRKSLLIAFLAISYRSAFLGVRNSLSVAFLDISDRYRIYFCEFIFTKWPLAATLDVRKSLSFALLAISDRYGTFVFEIFDKMAAGGHFGCPKFTFDRISGHFILIRNFF